jgi:hypothetical protein
MKSTTVLASLLFGSFAAAAPFDRRALVYKTEVVTETVVVYTTVYDDDEPVAQATTTPAGYFYEQPAAPSSAAAEATSSAQAAAYTSPAAEKPSSTYVAPAPQTPTPAATSSPAPVVEAPTPTPVVETPKPVETPQPAPTTSAYVAPAPAPVASPSPVASPAPAYSAPAASPPSSGGATYENVDITIYDNNGGFGACGTKLTDGDMIVALAKDAWGASTYDVMTGEATNPWCGQKIDVEYNGNHITATIMDMCPGCSGHDIDLSLSAWKALTNTDEKTRYKANWSKKD